MNISKASENYQKTYNELLKMIETMEKSVNSYYKFICNSDEIKKTQLLSILQQK